MPFAVVDQSSGYVLGYGQWQAPTHDPETQRIVETEDVEALKPEAQRLGELLEAAKKSKLAILAARWEEQCKAGIPVGQVRLACRETDVGLYTAAFTMAQTAVSAGAVSADGPFTIQDVEYQPLSLSLTELTTTLLAYGQARGQLSAAHGAALRGVQGSDSIDAVAAVSIPALV